LTKKTLLIYTNSSNYIAYKHIHVENYTMTTRVECGIPKNLGAIEIGIATKQFGS